MKNVKNIFALLIVWIVLGAGITNATEYTKQYKKEFNADSKTLLKIDNRYGNVTIENWDSNKINIEVTVAIENSKQEKADELLNYITINLSNQDDVIQAITTIDDKFNKHNDNNSNGKLLTITYIVKAPKYINLELINKYGNVYIDEILGYSNIAVRYGTLHAKNLSRDKQQPINKIYLAYTSKVAQIEKCNWVSIDIKYSKLNIDKAQAISVYSKYSTFKVGEASSIVAESRYDNYSVNKINNFTVTSGGYSDYILKDVSKKINITASYSDISIERLNKDFNSVDINNRYGSIKVNVDPLSVFEIIGHIRYGSISLPEKANVNRISESTETTINGTVGEGKTNSKMRLSAKYTTVKINTLE